MKNHLEQIQSNIWTSKDTKCEREKIDYDQLKYEINHLEQLYDGKIKNNFIIIDRENVGGYDVSKEER